MQMKLWQKVMALLVNVAAVNWGLARYLQFNAVDWFANLFSSFGITSLVSFVVYAAVTVGGVLGIVHLVKNWNK